MSINAAANCISSVGFKTFRRRQHAKNTINQIVFYVLLLPLAGLYAAFFGILSTEDLNLLLGAIFCFMVLACVMVMTRKLDWYKVT
ncbi:inner membrane CreD family protein [Psychrobacter sp. C 20.9]|uniref:inner membrane CreD family protein n=1 Tax=Psychrobacter sp. C 20.9 TaxID=1926477 RepID=UPI00353208A7